MPRRRAISGARRIGNPWRRSDWYSHRESNLHEHLARHRLADLFLDTLPYNAHTTASDALWAGLPVLTCLGSAFAGRVGSSLLIAVGLPELVARGLAEYEVLARQLATTPPMLAALRQTLSRNRTSFPLFDTDQFRRHIEAAYTAMWERYQRGEPHSAFSVDREMQPHHTSAVPTGSGWRDRAEGAGG